MKRASDGLRKFRGGNPFLAGDAKNYPDDKLVQEFYPTSLFWSLFSDQHQILLGTRGSGKTVLLRMLSYSSLRRFENQKAEGIIQRKSFIGFYVPTHLEWVATLPGKGVPDDQRLGYFQFAFNCLAAQSFLSEVNQVLQDKWPERGARLRVECRVVELLRELWLPKQRSDPVSIRDLQWGIEVMHAKQRFWRDGYEGALPILAKDMLVPIVQALPWVNDQLELPPSTTWLACIDEAEFLRKPFLRCLNTFLRSEKRPLIVKMATLPSKYATRETRVLGVSVREKGNDFSYATVDLHPDSDDFIQLTSHICRCRLGELLPSFDSLEAFVGTVGSSDSRLDYFENEMGPEEAEEARILDGIYESLSDRRRRHREEIRQDVVKTGRPILHRFAPVYYVRRMKHVASQGARTPGWFAGAKIIRNVADGNPRRFIQLMKDLVETARQHMLTPKYQHRVMVNFCRGELDLVEGLPDFGLVARRLLETVGRVLERGVHGEIMLDAGCGFRIERDLVDEPLLREALNLALDFSHVVREERDRVAQDLDHRSDLRLSFVHAVNYWLPMRKGDPFVLRGNKDHVELAYDVNRYLPITRKQVQEVVDQLQLGV